MQTLVFHGPQQRTREDGPSGRSEVPSDAIMKITRATICGTDLHLPTGEMRPASPERAWAMKVWASSIPQARASSV